MACPTDAVRPDPPGNGKPCAICRYHLEEVEKVQEFREIRRWRYTFRHISLSQTGSAGVPAGIFQKTNAGFCRYDSPSYLPE
jgi:hypothetical protein